VLGGNATPADALASITDYSREEMIACLLAAMGRKGWAREDAIRAASRHLGYSRAGRRIA
jgi:hypothetical protein